MKTPGGTPRFRNGRVARLAGLVAVIVLLALAAQAPAGREVLWGPVKDVRLSLEECGGRLGGRTDSSFRLSAQAGEPVRWVEVARWFRLDPEAVCVENGARPRECSERLLAPGETLVLPLLRDAGPSVLAPRSER